MSENHLPPGPQPRENADAIPRTPSISKTDAEIVKLLVAGKHPDKIAENLGVPVTRVLSLRTKLWAYIEAEQAKQVGRRLDGTAAEPKPALQAGKGPAAENALTGTDIMKGAVDAIAAVLAGPESTPAKKEVTEVTAKPVDDLPQTIKPVLVEPPAAEQRKAPTKRGKPLGFLAADEPERPSGKALSTVQVRVRGRVNRYTISGGRIGINGGALTIKEGDLDDFIAELMELRTIVKQEE